MAATHTTQSPVRDASLMFAGENASGSEAPGFDFTYALNEADELVRIGQDFRDFFARQARRIAALDYGRANRRAVQIEDTALTAVDALDPYLTSEALAVIYAGVRAANQAEAVS